LLLLLPFSTNRFSILEPPWNQGSPLAFHKQIADQFWGDQLGRAGEEGLGEGWEGVDGFGGGCVTKS
jgi:hypothetical protein